MSPAQHKRFYFPEWSLCAKANGWHNQAAIFGPQRNSESPLDAELTARVRVVAHQLAQKEHRGCTTNDFRYACHIVALGKDKSSLELTNDECTRVVDLFRVLAQPLSLKAVAHWADAALSKKENLIIQAKAKAPPEYIAAITADKFHTRVLEDLSIAQLQKLCFTLNQRKAKWSSPRSKVPSPKPREYCAGPF